MAWTRFDLALNEASRGNTLDAFIDNIKIERYEKRRTKRTRMGYRGIAGGDFVRRGGKLVESYSV